MKQVYPIAVLCKGEEEKSRLKKICDEHDATMFFEYNIGNSSEPYAGDLYRIIAYTKEAKISIEKAIT